MKQLEPKKELDLDNPNDVDWLVEWTKQAQQRITELEKRPDWICAKCKHLAKHANDIKGEKNCEHPKIGQIINSVDYSEAEYFGCNHFERIGGK